MNVQLSGKNGKFSKFLDTEIKCNFIHYQQIFIKGQKDTFNSTTKKVPRTV